MGEKEFKIMMTMMMTMTMMMMIMMMMMMIIIIIIIIKNKRANAGTRHRGTINNKDRIAATMYPLGTWFVPGICVWPPCIKETMM